MGSGTNRTRWGTFTDWCPSPPIRTSSNGWTTRWIWGSRPNRSRPLPKTSTGNYPLMQTICHPVFLEWWQSAHLWTAQEKFRCPTLIIGIVEGKFLERGRYKNEQNNNQFFGPYEFQIGKVLKINGYVYEILEIDEFTQKWLSNNPQKWIIII